MIERPTSFVIIHVPISSAIEAHEVLLSRGSYTGVTMESIYLVSAEQLAHLIEHDIPFERITREELHAIRVAERQLSPAERNEKGERLLREIREHARKHAAASARPTV